MRHLFWPRPLQPLRPLTRWRKRLLLNCWLPMSRASLLGERISLRTISRRARSPAILPLLKSSDVDVQLAAIDALIRLDADMSEDDLSAFLKTTNQIDPLLIILARDSKKHGDLLMRLLDRQLNDTDWIAVNSILSTAPPPGFAARLLREWTLHPSVQTYDTFISAGDGGCGWYGVKVTDRRAGFPQSFST